VIQQITSAWKPVVWVVCALWASEARAGSLEYYTSAGTTLFSQNLSYDSKPNSDRETGLDGNVLLSLSNQDTEIPGFGQVVDHTYTLNGGPDWRITKSWAVGGALNFSSTSEESLQQAGFTLYGEFTYYFGPEPEPRKAAPSGSGDEEGGFPADFLADEEAAAGDGSGGPAPFRPSISLRLIAGPTHMTDKPNRLLQQLFPALASRIDALNQGQLGFELGGSPWKWFSARLNLTGYSYDRDISEFLSFLSNRRSLGASSFAQTINGLPRSTSTLTLNFYPYDDWEGDVVLNGSTSAADDSKGGGLQLSAIHDFNNWFRIGMGIEHDGGASVQTLALLHLYFAI
jgi:hypothetical protein